MARVTGLFLGEGTRRVTMEIAPWCGAIYCIFGRGGSIFTPWGHQTTGFRDVVARAGDNPCDYVANTQSATWHLGEIYPTGVNFDEDDV